MRWAGRGTAVVEEPLRSLSPGSPAVSAFLAVAGRESRDDDCNLNGTRQTLEAQSKPF